MLQMQEVQPDTLHLGTGRLIPGGSTVEQRPQFMNEIDELYKSGVPMDEVHGAIDQHPQIQAPDKEAFKGYASHVYQGGNPGGYRFTPQQMNRKTEFVRPKGDSFEDDAGAGNPTKVKAADPSKPITKTI